MSFPTYHENVPYPAFSLGTSHVAARKTRVTLASTLELGSENRLSLRHGVLGLLMGRPMSGYELTKLFDTSLRFVWSASHSQIYPELAKLKKNGYIRQVEAGPRRRKRYAVTEKGERELHRWLTETEPDRHQRSEPFLRFFFLWTLDPEEVLELLQTEIEFHEAGLEEYQRIRESILENDSDPWGTLPVELGIRYREAILDWLDSAVASFERESRRRKRKRA
jgi:PadR family transcriptional regulator, regulatory protein AphA